MLKDNIQSSTLMCFGEEKKPSRLSVLHGEHTLTHTHTVRTHASERLHVITQCNNAQIKYRKKRILVVLIKRCFVVGLGFIIGVNDLVKM